jgi:hypothetical protein
MHRNKTKEDDNGSLSSSLGAQKQNKTRQTMSASLSLSSISAQKQNKTKQDDNKH